jgi:serine/threonine protein kinase
MLTHIHSHTYSYSHTYTYTPQGQFARLPSRYSENLQDVIRRMLAVDPKKRPRVEDLETHAGTQRALCATLTLAQQLSRCDATLSIA